MFAANTRHMLILILYDELHVFNHVVYALGQETDLLAILIFMIYRIEAILLLLLNMSVLLHANTVMRNSRSLVCIGILMRYHELWIRIFIVSIE